MRGLRLAGRCALALAGALLAGCDSAPPEDPARQTEQRLVGTWLREYAQDGMQVRRVLVLEQGGRFRELVSASASGVLAGTHAHAGEWLFDGTNLKRRYTSIDGTQPGAPAMPYATFELRFESRNVFVGTDHIRQRQVRYHRVEDGTLP